MHVKTINICYLFSIGTNTCFFIPHSEVPAEITPTYVRVVAAYRPEKDDPRRIGWTAGGNRVYYDGNTSAPRPLTLPP
jgi:hypothetical protein